MDTTVADPLVGQVLDERYLVRSRIARGGMATVYHGHDKKLYRAVALKVVDANLAADEGFVRRRRRRAGSPPLYRGHDKTLGRQMALKIIHTTRAADEGFVRRFIDEAKH